MKFKEGALEFDFVDNYQVLKFDETRFYRERFNGLAGSKGIDFLVEAEDELVMIEVKDCKGHESDNRWRLGINNSKKHVAPRGLDVEDRDSFDVEVAKKVAMSLACIVGAASFNCTELHDVLKKTIAVPVKIILFLEGEFQSKSRTKKLIMKCLVDSINKKLKWLNCKVFVEDMGSYKRKYFAVNRTT